MDFHQHLNNCSPGVRYSPHTYYFIILWIETVNKMKNKFKIEQKYEYFPDFRDTKIKLHIFRNPHATERFDSFSINIGLIQVKDGARLPVGN